MPIMDGYEATDKIREFLYIQGIVQPLIVAVTGHSEQQYEDRAIDSGINYVLSKPVTAKQIKEIVNFLGYPVLEKKGLNLLDY